MGRSAWPPYMLSVPATNWQNETMKANGIPEDVAAAIVECWPEGVIEEFDTDESYFYDIHAALELDLRRIPRASLLWQTEANDDRAYRDHDYDAEPPSSDPDFQSYHVFFLSPQGSEFEFETETDGTEEPGPLGDPDGESPTATFAGRGRHGCSVTVSLATPFAAVRFANYAQFEDGSNSTPDPGNVAYHNDTGEPVDLAASYRKDLGEPAFAKLQNLRSGIVKVLARHGVLVLDQAVLALPAPDLRSDGDVFLEGKELSVGDAFFFRGL